ncbi:MAG: HAD family phosphatase [Pleurocapsa sp.]
MNLKAVLFDFNGVIINDEPIHQQLIDEILIRENLRPDDADYKQYCLGKSDRAGLRSLLASRGRILSEDYLTKLIENKTKAYREKIESLENLPIYPNLLEFLSKLQERGILIGLVTGALRSEAEFILQRGEIAQYFNVIVGGEEVDRSKPEPDGYLLAVEILNQQNPNLNLQPQECLAIEDTPAGIEAAKKAQMQVVGIANTYPLHMLQRQANWTVDNLLEIELDRVNKLLSEK